MPVKVAKRAFLWRLNIGNFKATYGRYPKNSGDTSYTKNYLQVPGQVRDELNTTLGFGGVPVNFDWQWPSGNLENRYDNKDSNGDTRGQLYVTTGTGQNKKTILPFTPSLSPTSNQALTGDPNLATPAAATALMDQIIKSGIGAWYVAVTLGDEQQKLHARMILENPPPGKERFGLDRQPPAIQQAIRSADPSASSLWVDLEVRPRAGGVVAQVLDAFNRSPNVLLVGPPGCGKSVALEDVKAIYSETMWFDTERDDPWTMDARKVFETAFHPAYSYENFVAGLTPKPGEGINLEVRSGPLLNMAQWCRDDNREGLLLIDEFNRGPAAAIFGDTLVLLDKGKRSSSKRAGAVISQPHPDQDIIVPEEFASTDTSLGRVVPRKFSLPAGLRILGAFNSSDRSVAPLDAALLRRFSLVRVRPDADALAMHFGLLGFDPSDVAYQSKVIADWDSADVKRLTIHLLLKLNDRLRQLLGEDHEVGHALFWEVPIDADREQTASTLAAEFEEKVVGRLRQTLRDRDEQLAAILNVPDRGESGGKGVADWINDESRVGRLVGARLSIRNLKDAPFEDQIHRLLFVISDRP